MPVMRVLEYQKELELKIPVSGAGAAIPIGSLLGKKTTPASNNGHLELLSGNNANINGIGILKGAHATANDCDVAGTTYSETGIDATSTVHPIELVQPWRIIRMEYSQASADLITVTSNVGTTLTIGSLETNIHAAFIYVVSGTGAGQTNYVTGSSAGSCTLKAAFATTLDATSKIIKILPRFHGLISLNSAGQRLSSQAAAGAMKWGIVETWYVNGNNEQRMSPTAHAALTGLQNVQSLRFEADVAVVPNLIYALA